MEKRQIKRHILTADCVTQRRLENQVTFLPVISTLDSILRFAVLLTMVKGINTLSHYLSQFFISVLICRARWRGAGVKHRDIEIRRQLINCQIIAILPFKSSSQEHHRPQVFGFFFVDSVGTLISESSVYCNDIN